MRKLSRYLNRKSAKSVAKLQRASKFSVERLEARLMLYDGDFVGLIKEDFSTQTSDAAPTLNPSQGYFFSAVVDENAAPKGHITGTVTLPNSTVDHLIFNSNTFRASITLPFDTAGDLDAGFPAGTYGIDFTDVGGEHSFSLSTAADDYPTPPQVVNFSALQDADSTQDLDLQWQPLNGGTPSDFVQVTIQLNGNTVFASAPFDGAGALNGSDTDFTIPADTLAADETYQVNVAFVLPGQIDTHDTELPGISAFGAVTSLSLITQGMLGAPTSVTSATFPRHVQLTWGAVSGAAGYQVFRSTTNDFEAATKIASGLTTLSYNDSTAAPGVLYYYWIRARNSNGIGAPSDAVTGVINLPAPTGFTATNDPHHVALTWNAVTGASGYQVFRNSTDDVNTATKIAAGFDTTFFNDNTAVLGQTYFYWIRARNSAVIGLFSVDASGNITA